VIENLPRNLSSPVSVDTTKPAVARKALSEGAAIINNVAHTDESLELMMTAAEFGAGYRKKVCYNIIITNEKWRKKNDRTMGKGHK
jgi:dihydropteroate synthase